MNCCKKATMPAKGVGERDTTGKSSGEKRRNIRGRQIGQRHAQIGESQSKTEAVQSLFTNVSDHPAGLQRRVFFPEINKPITSSPEYIQGTSFEDKYHRNKNSQQNRAYIKGDSGISKRFHAREEKSETVVTKQMRNGPKVHTSGSSIYSVDRGDKSVLSHHLPQNKISPNEKADELPSRRRQHENSQVISPHGETPIKARLPPQGLPNIGNTCYANSLLQVLGQTPRLFEIFSSYSESDTRRVNLTKMNVSNAFGHVFQSMNHQPSRPKFTTITQFMDIVSSREHEFRIGYQNDCHSFLLTLLSELSKETPGKDVAHLFETEMVDRFTFDSCRHTEETDTQILRSLTIPSESLNVEEGLQSLFQTEEFDEQDVPCRKCLKGHGKTRKSMMFWNLPRVLVLQLGCFQEMSYGGLLRIAKSSRRISFDKVLRVPHRNGNIETYQLYGVVNHHGSTYGGHYTSYVKHLPHQSDWYICNDSHVSKSTLPDALSSPDAYLLFYKL